MEFIIYLIIHSMMFDYFVIKTHKKSKEINKRTPVLDEKQLQFC